MNPIRRRGRREGTGLRAAPFSPSLAQRRGRSEVKEGPGRDPLALLWKERPLIPVRGKLKGVQRSHQGQGPEVNHLDNRQAPCPAWSPSPRVSVTCSQPRRRFTCSGSHPESPLLRALPGARSPRSKEPDAPLTLLLPKAFPKSRRAVPAPGPLTTLTLQLRTTCLFLSPSTKRRKKKKSGGARGGGGGKRSEITCQFHLLPWEPDPGPWLSLGASSPGTREVRRCSGEVHTATPPHPPRGSSFTRKQAKLLCKRYISATSERNT